MSSNKLELFPSTFCELRLKEFHCDNNPLLPYIPVPAEQQEEVLRLKVLKPQQHSTASGVLLLHPFPNLTGNGLQIDDQGTQNQVSH